MSDEEQKIFALFSKANRAKAALLNAQGSPHVTHYALNDDHVCVPVGLGTWAIWLERFPKKRRVALDTWLHTRMQRQIAVEVSTVFLGLDHNFSFANPERRIKLGDEDMQRRLFETMVFWGRTWIKLPVSPKRRVRREHYQERYPTWDTAVAGHARIIEKTKLYLDHRITKDQYYSD